MKTLRAHYVSMKEWRADPKGYFTIKPFPKEQLLRVRFCNYRHEILITLEGKSAEELYNTIVREGLVSKLEHAAYLGSELQKAELAMKYDLEYVQDSPLTLGVKSGAKQKAGSTRILESVRAASKA